jgi:hypothetical protein
MTIARRIRFAPWLFLALVAFLAPGCKDDSESPQVPANEPVPDFALNDANTNSATYGQVVSPRQQQGKISAWYFGAAT